MNNMAKESGKKNRSTFMYSECPPHKHASCEISKMRMCVSMSNLCKLVHMSGIHCHVCASSTTGCSFLYLTMQYCIEYSSIGSFSQSRMSGRKHKSSGDISGTANKCQELEAQRKNKEEKEEVTQRLKRSIMQEMARGFYLRKCNLFVGTGP